MPDTSRVRNIAVVGTHHAGKTTLVEAILSHCGATSRRGAVTDGTSTTDYEPECIAHAQSTTVGFAHCTADGIDMTLVDCPGFIDFFEETKVAISGCDAAVIVLDGEPLRVSQTQAIVDFIESRKMPHIFVVNKLDRPGSDFNRTLEALQKRIRPACGRRTTADRRCRKLFGVRRLGRRQGASLRRRQRKR